jgi:hypothetical protein
MDNPGSFNHERWDLKVCPFCAESVNDEAVKCRYCGETLVGIEADWQRYRVEYLQMAHDEQLRAWAALSDVQRSHFYNILAGKTATDIAQTDAQLYPNAGAAALLSLILPGAGQMYKGHVGGGLLWFFGVAGAYMVGFSEAEWFLAIAVLLHLLCIFGAAARGSTR